jgi:glycosyltransferase involved in cell wall biosynthesis
MMLLTAVTFGGQDALPVLGHLPDEEAAVLRHRAERMLEIPRDRRIPLLVQEIKRLVTARKGHLWSAEPEALAKLLQQERPVLRELILRALPVALADAVRLHLPATAVQVREEVPAGVLGIVRWKLEGLLQHHDVRVLGLGAGERWMEEALTGLAARYPQKMGMHVGHAERLAHRLEAAGDFFLMPSRFEPCGLNQLYSQRYGTVPVVRAVGGLADTVLDVGAGQGTGIVFREYAAGALWHALERALGLFHAPGELAQVRRRGMAQDFSWERSARAYEWVYRGA